MAITKITTPELFDFSATNTALQLPTGTTAQRPTSPSTGEWRFNTDEKYVEYWDGSAWKQIDTEELPNPDDFPSQNFNVNTYFGNGATQAIDAKFNEAANFNGSSSAIIIQDGGIGNNGTARVSFSVSIWVNTEATSASAIISDYDGLDYSFYLQMNANGTLNIGNYMDGVGSFTSGTATINDGNWHNLVLINNTSDNTQKLFVDGNSTPDINHTLTSGTKNAVAIQVGYYATGGNFLKGKLDQIRFFNAPIISSDITALYSNETTTTAATLNFPVGAGCVAAYQLDGDASDVGGTYGGVETDIGYTGLRFQADMIWIKNRVGTQDHVLFDSARGVQEVIRPNTTDAEFTGSGGAGQDYLSAFNSNGFTVGDATNTGGSSGEYVAWCWKAGGAPDAINGNGAGVPPTLGSVMIDGVKSTAALAGTTAATKISANTKTGFSVVEYTAAGSVEIAHGLTQAPEIIIQKRTDVTSEWVTYTATTGLQKYLQLQDDAQVANDANFMTAVGASTFTSQWSSNSHDYINYCFHSVAGYQKAGSYTGNGGVNTISTEVTSGDGGFEPAFIMYKAIDASSKWWAIRDNKRGADRILFPNKNNTEETKSPNNLIFLTNGFQLQDGDSYMNGPGVNYIYLAIAADKDSSVPTQANSFSPTLYTGNGATQNIYTPFAPDFTWLKERSGTQWNSLYDSIRGVGNRIVSNSSNGQNNDPNRLSSFNPNSFSIGTDGDTNTLNDTYASWNWKAGGLPTINNDGTNITSIVSANQAAGFSIVKYTGIGSTASVGHGLGVIPKLIIAKCLDITSAWVVYSETTGIDKFIELNDLTPPTTSSGYWGSSAPTTSVFEVNNGNSNNNSTGNNIIAYCFADITGYQKIGSYTWTGTSYTAGTLVTNLGFTPRFVIIKNTTVDGDWQIYDNQRVSGTQSYALYADLEDAESTAGQQGIIFDSDGFSAGTGADGNVTASSSINKNGSTYIYLAIG